MAAREGTATRGRRIPLLPDAQVRAEGPVQLYVCGGRPLRHGKYVLTDGVEVPGAADWPRLEAWVQARRIRPIRSGEDYVPFEAFQAEQDRILQEKAETEIEAQLQKAETEQKPEPEAEQKPEQKPEPEAEQKPEQKAEASAKPTRGAKTKG